MGWMNPALVFRSATEAYRIRENWPRTGHASSAVGFVLRVS